MLRDSKAVGISRLEAAPCGERYQQRPGDPEGLELDHFYRCQESGEWEVTGRMITVLPNGGRHKTTHSSGAGGNEVLARIILSELVCEATC